MTPRNEGGGILGDGTLADIAATVHSLHRDVRKLAEIVHEGNGKDPLIARIAVIEAQLDEIESKLQEAQLHRWQILLAMVTGAISLIISIGLNIVEVGYK